MLRPAASSLIAFACALNLQAADNVPQRVAPLEFQLFGIVRPAGDSAGTRTSGWRVTLMGVERSLVRTTQLNTKGEYQFSGLPPGSYTLAILHPQWGEVRRTIAIQPDHADRSGVIRADVSISAAEAAESSTVSVTELAVPTKALDKYAEAQQQLARRNSRGAIEQLQAAVAIAPEFAAAWNALGVIAIQTHPDEPAAAERYFRQGLQADKSAFDPILNLGGLLLKAGRPDEALTYNCRAAELRPKDALANAQLGMNYYQLGQLDSAEKYLLQAKQLDPAQYSLPQLFLAEIYARKGNRTAALAELEQLVAQRPNDPLLGAVQNAITKLKRSSSVE